MAKLTLGDLVYDPRVKRFRYPEGKFATGAAVKFQTEKFIRARQSELIGLAGQIRERPGDVALQTKAADLLRDIHVAQASLAAGGPQFLYANDYLIIGRALRSQYGLSDNSPSPYGLRYLFNDVASGKVSEAQLANRLSMFGESGKVSFYGVQVNKRAIEGFTHARRHLSPAENCRECIDYAGYGWVGIRDLIWPTQKCSCKSNCKCTVEFARSSDLTPEELAGLE
jgi:hypothetical protein